MRQTAAEIVPRERVADCGRKAIGSQVTLHVHVSDGRAHFGGVETCGSIWMCPVCAAKITEIRRIEIDTALKGHAAIGGATFMATLTVPHHAFQKLRSLRDGVSKGFRSVKSGKAWMKKRQECGWLGDIRALEVTHGGNGWHPHLHVLVMFAPGTTDDQFYAFGDWLYERWARSIERQELGDCSKDAFDWVKVNASTGAADYVSKWGAGHELAKANTRIGRGESRTPWEILRDAENPKNTADRALFRDYAHTFKGTRHLTWSRGLRDRYLTGDERPDEEVAVEVSASETHQATMGRDLFKAVASRKLTAAVLDAFERRGLQGLIALLDHHGITWGISMAPAMQPGRFVPVLSSGSPGEPPGHRPGPSQGTTRENHQSANPKGTSHADQH